MDKIKQLRERKATLKKASENVRAEIAALTDEDSFVELAAFSFSKDNFYHEDAQGEGVVTGFATIGGYPFYIVAQNFEQSFGGLSKANCEKIAKTLNAAEKNATPVVYLLHSYGVRVGEGVNVLEGISELLLKATQLKGTVMQFAVVCGEVYGSSAALASVCDCVFFTEKSTLAVTSPMVLSAKEGKNLKKEEVGGYNALGNALLPAISVKNMGEVASHIMRISDLISIPVIDAKLNESSPALNKKADAKAVLGVLENGVELGGNSCPEVKTVLCRIGGIAVAAAVFDNVKLNSGNVKKLRNFAEFACCYGLPFITFVDCTGVEETMQSNNSALLKEICEYLSILDTIDTAKIAVVTGRAAGLGYSLFAAKSVGFDYTYALATSQISLFESQTGAEIEYANEKRAKKEELQKLYTEENADPFHAAKGGYLDNIIEPQFLKQYLVASLQTLVG
ncbi:MAG: hypothetical protein K2G44_04870 [Clostridia bacterium]|nr:hypothetical protein [Clostridia bacterium]